MVTMYVRYEPTKDELLTSDWATKSMKRQLAKKKDVVMYKDAEATKLDGRWLWYYKSKPNKNTKTMVICGVRCQIVWLPDLE